MRILTHDDSNNFVVVQTRPDDSQSKVRKFLKNRGMKDYRHFCLDDLPTKGKKPGAKNGAPRRISTSGASGKKKQGGDTNKKGATEFRVRMQRGVTVKRGPKKPYGGKKKKKKNQGMSFEDQGNTQPLSAPPSPEDEAATLKRMSQDMLDSLLPSSMTHAPRTLEPVIQPGSVTRFELK